MTDQASWYKTIGGEFRRHDTVDHMKKSMFAAISHTTPWKVIYSIFKRGMKGVYQHCAEKHLHRYLAEFDFRYSAIELRSASTT